MTVMILTCRTLAEQFTVEVEEHTEAAVKAAIAAHLHVNPRLLTLIPFEDIDYAVIIEEAHWELLPWVNQNALDWDFLSTNPRAICLLQSHPDRINWNMLSKNPAAMEMLKENPERISWEGLAANPHPDAISMIAAHLKECDLPEPPTLETLLDKPSSYYLWQQLSANPSALPLLANYPTHIKWDSFADKNPSPNVIPFMKTLFTDVEIARSISHRPEALPILEEHRCLIDHIGLSRNPAGIPLLLTFPPAYISWYALSGNPAAIPFIKENMDKVDWRSLCKNPEAMELITDPQYRDRIKWDSLCSNPNPAAMDFLEEYLQQTNIEYTLMVNYGRTLSRNPAAIPLLSRHPQYVHWKTIAALPEIFEWVS